MKLLDRILAGQWETSVPHADSVHQIRAGIRDAFPVDVQNIYDWFDQSWNRGDSLPLLKEICPLFKLPFPRMWCEFHRAKEYQIGVLLEEEESSESESDPPEVIMYMFWYQRTMRRAKHFATMAGAADPKTFALRRIDMALGIDPDATEQDAEAELTRMENDDIGEMMRQESLYPVIASIAFFHCRNVTIRRVTRSVKIQKKLKKKLSLTAIPTFHVIEIHRRQDHAIERGTIERVKGNPRTAFIRGHFKKFEGASKLFGKRNGIWFWAMHVRGDGRPLKSEYRTWPPEGTHRKKCLVQIQ